MKANYFDETRAFRYNWSILTGYRAAQLNFKYLLYSKADMSNIRPAKNFGSYLNEVIDLNLK